MTDSLGNTDAARLGQGFGTRVFNKELDDAWDQVVLLGGFPVFPQPPRTEALPISQQV